MPGYQAWTSGERSASSSASDECLRRLEQGPNLIDGARQQEVRVTTNRHRLIFCQGQRLVEVRNPRPLWSRRFPIGRRAGACRPACT